MNTESITFERRSKAKRLSSILSTDIYRALRSKLFYILILTAILIPIVMTVMMTMMDGSVSVDPNTGKETMIQGPESTWESIGALPNNASSDEMDVLAMCNINMMFMLVSVFVCIFISEDYRSGFSKSIFTQRGHKSDYVISKTLVGSLCGMLMLLAYFVGSLLGGAISGLSFAQEGFSALNILMCILAKLCLIPLFVSIFVMVSVITKHKAWLSLCISLGGGMMLFMLVPMITPLTSTISNVIICLIAGGVSSVLFGVISSLILKKTSQV